MTIRDAINLCAEYIAEVQREGRRANIECLMDSEDRMTIRACDSKNVLVAYDILALPEERK